MLQKFRRGLFSPLTLRILAINAIAPAMFLSSSLYLDYYRQGLIEARLESLEVLGQLIGGALAETAGAVADDLPTLGSDAALQIVRRLAAITDTRVRLFSESGMLVTDSKILLAAGRDVIVRPLPPIEEPRIGQKAFDVITDWISDLLPDDRALPLYREPIDQRAADYGEVIVALNGDVGRGVRENLDGRMVLSVAMPVQVLHKVLGAVMLNVDSREIEARVQEERLNAFKLFLGVLGLAALLSIFLASTIARPVRKLAEAADIVRHGQGRHTDIPDFSVRRDEIGELSVSLRAMTDALYQRLDAIESFAADVAHELKNPLTSLRSAVETLGRASEPSQVARLREIIQDDVRRLDRLISDISNASRLEAELSRTDAEPVSIAALVTAIGTLYRDQLAERGIDVSVSLPEDDPLWVMGLESRLGQVMRNLIDNAISFSPEGGRIDVMALRFSGQVRVTVMDQGPGIPEDKLEAIFDRFYTERPEGEPFGKHSGLGLSISKQIVTAHRGRLYAANRRSAAGDATGAVFTLDLPSLDHS